jgi:thiamine-phosphate pyrophosphorylase
MKFDYGLYPVITGEFCKERSLIQVLEAVIAGGAKIVQLREKNISLKDFYLLAREYRKITERSNVKLIINDHVDLALAVQADGVHLGQDDLPCAAARKIAPDLIIGVSTHNLEEIEKAEEDGASYINIGPIFATSTKVVGVIPLGLDYLKNAETRLPFSVMGGIKKDNIESVLQCGARNIAMVTAITMADDITKTTREFVDLIDKYRNRN